MKILKISILIILTMLALNMSVGYASRVVIGVGTSYGEYVRWIPGHWYHGYWVPGQYVEYAGPAPGAGFIWYQGGFDGGHRWHNGHWGSHGGGGHRHH